MAQLREGKAVWTCDVTVLHDSGYGKRVCARVLPTHGDWIEVGNWTWTTHCIPRSLVLDIQARLAATVGEHLITRYGVQVDFLMPGEGPKVPPATA